jgi:hypothetical protein
MSRIIHEKFRSDTESSRYWDAIKDFREAATDLVRLYTGDTEITKAFKATVTRVAYDAAERVESVPDALAWVCSDIHEHVSLFRKPDDSYGYDRLLNKLERAINLAASQNSIEIPITYGAGKERP